MSRLVNFCKTCTVQLKSVSLVSLNIILFHFIKWRCILTIYHIVWCTSFLSLLCSRWHCDCFHFALFSFAFYLWISHGMLFIRGGTGREFRRVPDPGTRPLLPGRIRVVAGSRYLIAYMTCEWHCCCVVVPPDYTQWNAMKTGLCVL